VDADLAGLEIDLLPFAEHRADLQIDDAALAERRNHRAGLGVELDELKSRRHVDHAIVALAVGPVRHAAAGELARRDGRALALAQAVGPDHLAGLAVERDDRAARAAGGVEDAFDLGGRPEVVGFEPPGDF
jgi:hypothetical protein